MKSRKRKTLNDRVLEAKALARESNIQTRDKQGRVKVVLVPASKATINRVILRRHNNGIISAECSKLAGNYSDKPCLGNKSGVCRHSIAAIIVALEDTGYIPRFRKQLTAAETFANRNSGIILSDSQGEPAILRLHSWKRINKLYFIAEDISVKELS